MGSLTSQEVQELLTQPNNAIIAVNRSSGGPQVTPVWYLWDGEDFYFFSFKGRAKYINIERDPSISLLVDGGPRYVAAYGQAQIIYPDASDFAALAVQLSSKYVSAEEVENRLKVAQEPGTPVVLFKLHPEKVVAIDYRRIEN